MVLSYKLTARCTSHLRCIISIRLAKHPKSQLANVHSLLNEYALKRLVVATFFMCCSIVRELTENVKVLVAYDEN